MIAIPGSSSDSQRLHLKGVPPNEPLQKRQASAQPFAAPALNACLPLESRLEKALYASAQGNWAENATPPPCPRIAPRFCRSFCPKPPALTKSQLVLDHRQPQIPAPLHRSNMSTPNRRQRDSQSATPRRSTRHSEAGTPAQLVSSPLFYQSSPAPAQGIDEVMGDVSSPLRQMSNSQSTQPTNGHAPSSPLRQMTDTQSTGQRTPRASAGLAGGMLYYIQLYRRTDLRFMLTVEFA